jgi:hypothetical protein
MTFISGGTCMNRRADRVIHLRRLSGVVSMSMGFGMLLVLLLPAWGFLLAALLLVTGFWRLFIC